MVASQHTLKIRLEKNGRGGKTVTVVFELPSFEVYFKDLEKKLKALCGTGGSFKNNMIEIQGDHREKIKAFLEKLGFKVKLAGG
jgi:translation initiation factor 1